jgi:hypothetical protein
MNKLFGLFPVALSCFAPASARAATCFWFGGTGNINDTSSPHPLADDRRQVDFLAPRLIPGGNRRSRVFGHGETSDSRFSDGNR